MNYIELILPNVLALALVTGGHQYAHKTHRVAQWSCYTIALIVWGYAQYLTKANWIEMIISFAGIILFAWLISGFIDDKHR